MRSLDTNVLARWLLGDDPAQAEVAERIITEPVRVSHTVLLELGWVLHRALGLPRETVADMMDQVLNLDTVTIEHAEQLPWAIARYRQGADWGDVMHLVVTPEDGNTFTTFDRKLARRAGADAPLAIETLRA